MQIPTRIVLSAAIFALALPGGAAAHHSFAAHFQMDVFAESKAA